MGQFLCSKRGARVRRVGDVFHGAALVITCPVWAFSSLYRPGLSKPRYSPLTWALDMDSCGNDGITAPPSVPLSTPYQASVSPASPLVLSSQNGPLVRSWISAWVMLLVSKMVATTMSPAAA